MLKGKSELKKYSIFRNYRLFDEEDEFETKELCDYCGDPLEQYVVLENHIFICKGCLDKMIRAMDIEFIKWMKKAVRR